MGRRRGRSSRVRSSILMTWAPKSARKRVASAPTPIQQKSTTRISASGPRRARGLRSADGTAAAGVSIAVMASVLEDLDGTLGAGLRPLAGHRLQATRHIELGAPLRAVALVVGFEHLGREHVA